MGDRYYYDPPDEPPCDICGNTDCYCPECAVCGVVGDRNCIGNHMPSSAWHVDIKDYLALLDKYHAEMVRADKMGDELAHVFEMEIGRVARGLPATAVPDDPDWAERERQAREIIAGLTDGDDDCRLDHHGWCQTHHRQFNDGLWHGRCPYSVAREWLEAVAKETK